MMLSAYIVFGICMTGCAATAWHLGRRVGIENTVQFFKDRGQIEVDDASN